MESNTWLNEAASTFSAACAAKLMGPGEREAAIRAPVDALLAAVGEHLGLSVVAFDEVPDGERGVRSDFAVQVNGAICGYVEVKAPGRPIEPSSFTGHDAEQWQRLADMPNLLYTNGIDWRLYRNGGLVGPPARLEGGDLGDAGASLAPGAGFEQLLNDFLRWRPLPITSVGALVRAVAPLTRLLRDAVLAELERERRMVGACGSGVTPLFLALCDDWRYLLFPDASDTEFADGYAQTVAFALLLARAQGVDFNSNSLREIANRLDGGDSLMSTALDFLTEGNAPELQPTTNLVLRVVGAIDWPRVQAGRGDTYLHLYEHFLDVYDSRLRQATGTYYTPFEVVEPMVRLAEDALRTRLGVERGYQDESVEVLDPAMGTGTYLLSIIDAVADQVRSSAGPGAMGQTLTDLSKRLIGFELQTGPYAVAELRTAEAFATQGAAGVTPRLFVTNTLEDPHSESKWIPAIYSKIALDRKQANQVKSDDKITICIGNPPYGDRAEGRGAWVEHGGEAAATNPRPPLLDDFRDPEGGRFAYTLKNLYIYFWRWATWKVWESASDSPGGDAGIVCFITPSGYLAGPGFTGMRRYLREWASDGWIIDLSPEGQTPPIGTRVFPGVRQPLAIGLFVRTSGKSREIPASIRFRALAGSRQQKFAALAEVGLDDAAWQDVRSEWTAPFTPAADSAWDEYPAMDDLFPWASPGVAGARRWPFAPSAEILKRRWGALRAADPKSAELRAYLDTLPGDQRPMLNDDPAVRAIQFRETSDRGIGRGYDQSLNGEDASAPIADASGEMTHPIRLAYRAFDRAWMVPDYRLLDRPRPELWAARQSGQVFAFEQHAHRFEGGPGLLVSALLPNQHNFNNRGGRVLPLLHADGSPNVAAGLLDALSARFGRAVAAQDLLAYVAAITAHPAYTATFDAELATPGIRVPITRDPHLFQEAVELGNQVIRLHTYGAWGAEGDQPDDIQYPLDDPRRIRYLEPITGMPDQLSYDAASEALTVGDGVFSPVPQAVFRYQVGGKNIVKQWFDYRKRVPGGRRTSPLDYIHSETWLAEWSNELMELLSVLAQLVDLEPAQADLLERVIAGDVLTKSALAGSGAATAGAVAGEPAASAGSTAVRWPAGPNDPSRAPRRAPTTGTYAQTLF